ncbi:hypothetical protein V4U86_14630 [Mycobacterium sp. AMU20-3851]|uniref:hypothetical protein n=1 Tax=Mycobacterium sp. AMU20-3851 TaxID=3122055 RepID=UPI0037548227
MPDLEAIAAQVVLPFGTTARNVVSDAFKLIVREEDRFVESKIAIERLEFASFAVGGLAAAAQQPAQGAVRSSSEVTLPLADSTGATASAGLTVTLYGPGDVRGIDAAQIVRRYPAPGTLTAEETVLAHVEFNRPELPWAFSAAPAAVTLRPWLTLIVVERSAVQWESGTGLLPVLRVPVSALPPLTAAHLWAHSQTAVSENESPLPVRMSPEFAAVNLSRLVSPLVLRQDTDYVAAVVPTTDVGARGGLGLTGGTLDPAWTSASADPVRLPVYDRWEFRTGPDGDFTTLALRLTGVVAPYEVGRRFIDVSEPGKPLGSLPDDEVGAKQVLRCALYSPSPPTTPEQSTAETAVWPESMIEDLRTQLDLPAQIEGTQERTGGIPDLPIVGPRIYAKLHRGSAVITGEDWFSELNLTPTNRIVAGLGTRVVQRDQEQLMQAAWAQLGEVEKANRAIRLAQLSELLAQRMHRRITDLQQGRLLQIAAPLAARVSISANRTLALDIAESATPTAAVSGAFRRSTRPDGPVLRRAGATTRRRAGELVGTDAVMKDFTRVYRNPDGVGGLSTAAIASLDASLVAAAIAVPIGGVPNALSVANATMAGGLASLLTDPGQWADPRQDFDLGAMVVEQWGERVRREAPIPALAAVRAQRVGPLAAELAKSGAAARAGLRERFESQAVTFNNTLVDRVGGVRGLGGVGALGGVVDRVGGVANPVGGIARDGAVLRGVAIGAGVRRLPGAGGRLAVAGAGRLPGRIRGLNQLNPALLQRVTNQSPADARATALTRLAELAEVRATPVLDRIDAFPITALRAEMAVFADPGGVLGIDKVPRRDTLTIDTLTQRLDPAHTVRAALNGRLRLSHDLAPAWFAKPVITPIMAAPRFNRPMYQALNDYDRDWLVPGLGLLPAEDFVTVLESNSVFMESFLVGLSDEMGRELLWRNYPTDQRGTYFRRFWDAQDDELTQPVHAFSRTPLSRHISAGGSGGSEPRAVIVVKSELVRRFPDLIIQAVRNPGPVNAPDFDQGGAVAEQLFAAHLEPDIALVGVNLAIDELDRPEWWILIAEHPTATRFDRPIDADIGAADLIDGKFLTVPSASDSAAFAKARLHDPVRVAFQATDLIKRGE